MIRPLRINAVEMLRQPGSVQDVAAHYEADVLDVFHERLSGPIEVELALTSMNDGIAVVGSVGAPWAAPCRRCLRDLTGVALSRIEELYQVVITDPDAFPIENGQLDLVPMVREAALLELDDERVCRDGCAGLCPVCGIDRNESSCECDTTVRDDRWAALDGIELEPDPPNANG